MRVKFLFVVSFLLISVMLFGSQTVPSHLNKMPFTPSRGDTDQYGYICLLSSDPGGPTYNWIDITGIGTEVTGLTDDNNVGPFNIGFDFPYYWYTVDKFYVNANGGISFSDPAVYTPQGASGWIFPGAGAPNDIVIPLGADLTFELGPPAHCYYYSNNVDTLIVSYIQVPAWQISGPTGEHTFQLILTRADSCIYFEWGEQVGSFYNGECAAGMENIIGNDGVQAFYFLPPSSIEYEAAKITPPDSTTYQALDVGVEDILSEGSEGVFMFPGDHYSLTAKVHNYGTQDAGSFEVSIQVWDTSYVSQFVDTITVGGLAAGAESTIAFSPQWSPPTVDNYLAFVKLVLAGDINPNNNTRDVEIKAMTLPGWMLYDSDPSSASGIHWYGAGGGWGQEFEPPQYPIVIDSVSIAMSTTNNTYVPIVFMDDDGANGFPGTVLHYDSIYITAGTGFLHYSMYIPPSAGTFTDGKFYVGMIQRGDSFPSVMHDANTPYSRRCWELTGSWSPSRERENYDVMIRAHSNSAQAVGEEKKQMSYSLSLLPVRPNPVSGPAQIYYMVPAEGNVSLKIFNLLGQEVKTLVNEHKSAGAYSAIFNTNELAQGVYFYRLTTAHGSLTRRLILLK